MYIFDDEVEVGRGTKPIGPIVDQILTCIDRLEAIYVNGERPNISFLGFQPYIICTNFIAEDILIEFNIEQRKRFLKNWRLYCSSVEKENELIEKQSLELDQIIKVS